MGIEHVVIVGAGAMGSLYASHFENAGCFRVTFVARGERARRLRDRGVVVNGNAFSIDVFDAAEPDGRVPCADLVIVAVKHHQLDAALEDISPLVDASTIFLSVLNGLDSERIIAERFGADKVLLCIALAMDATREDNRVAFRQAGRLQFGANVNDRPDRRVTAVQDALDRAKLKWDTPVEMLRAVWWKFMVNVGVNQASAIMRADYGACLNDPDTRWLMDALIAEVVALSKPAGIELGVGDVERWHEVLEAQPSAGKTSMLQDIEAGRPTEVEIFAGRVVSMGRDFCVATPVNEVAYHVIKRISD